MMTQTETPMNVDDLWPLLPLERGHTSWFDSWFGDNNFVQTVDWQWRKSSTLNNWINQKFPICQQHDWQWLNENKHIWSNAPKDICSYFQFLGAVFCHKHLFSLILKSEINACKDLLGASTYSYCKQQVSFLVSKWPESWHQSLDFTALGSQLFQLGLAIHLRLTDTTIPISLQKRICTWFPHSWNLSFKAASFISSEELSLAKTLLEKAEKHKGI